MAHLPKGFRNNININPGKIGPERRQEILDDIADNGTFLPRGVSEEDMDESFLDFVKTVGTPPLVKVIFSTEFVNFNEPVLSDTVSSAFLIKCLIKSV